MHSGDQSDLGRIYDGAKELFLLGEHDRALDRFKSIYEVDCAFRDVAEIVDDYYDTTSSSWIAKFEARFQEKRGSD